MKKYDFLIIGAGIFGLCAALELQKRKYRVAILNPDQIPHPLAASTDISKAVRMEYGSDMEYMEMAIIAMDHWRNWNELFSETLFHESGYFLASSSFLTPNNSSYESTSYASLLKKGFQPERLNPAQMAQRFPAINCDNYKDGFYHALGGYAESGRVVRQRLKNNSLIRKNIGL